MRFSLGDNPLHASLGSARTVRVANSTSKNHFYLHPSRFLSPVDSGLWPPTPPALTLRPPSPPSPVASHQLRPTAHQHGRQSSPACPPGRVQGSPRGSFKARAAIQMLVVDRTSPRHVLPTNPSPSVALSLRARYANALKPARLHGSYHMAVFLQAC